MLITTNARTRSTQLADCVLEDAAAGCTGLAASLATAILSAQLVAGAGDSLSVWQALVAVEHLDDTDRAALEVLTAEDRPARVTAGQVAYDIIGHRRSSNWSAQSIVEQGAGLNMADSADAPPMNSTEAWWYYQGRAEAFAESMTVLEREGLATVGLVVNGRPL